MYDNTKNFENTALTDEQAEQVSGGQRRPRSSKIELTDDQQTSRATAWPPMNPPHRNNSLTDDQLDQVSGGRSPLRAKGINISSDGHDISISYIPEDPSASVIDAPGTYTVGGNTEIHIEKN